MKRLLSVAVCFILYLSTANLFGAEVEINELIKDVQRIKQGSGSIHMIIWTPREYWSVFLEKTPNLTKEQRESFLNAVDKYVIFIVVDAKISTFGTLTATSQEDIQKNISLSMDKKERIKPISPDELSDETKALLMIMKPVFANTMGQLGKGMEFVCFNVNDSEGNKLIDPLKKGAFTIKLEKDSFKWRLPLGSLLPPKFDPKTDEKFPGSYEYNPFTGDKLVIAPPDKD
jgi:hypothetical protein